MAMNREIGHEPTPPAELVLLTEEYLCQIAVADFDGRAAAAATLRSLANLFRPPLCLDEDDICARREEIERQHPKPAYPLAAAVDRWRANIPAAMLDLRQWVNWRTETRNGRETEVLYCPGTDRPAETDNAATFGTFTEACTAYMRGTRYAGIGYVFTSWDDFAGVDFDKCMGDDGTMRPDVAAWVAALDSYTEVSPGGRGIHVILRAALPGGKGCQSVLHGVEAYSQLRCLTMTGDLFLGAPQTIEPRQKEVERLLVELFPASPPTVERAPVAVVVVVAEPPLEALSDPPSATSHVTAPGRTPGDNG